MTTLESLKAEQESIYSIMRTDKFDRAFWAENKVRLSEIESAVKVEKIAIEIRSVNSAQKLLRDKAELIWECEQPKVDITNQDGSFHATKVKAYSNISNLNYGRGIWEDGKLLQLSVGGKEFKMFYLEYVKNEKVYTRPENFDKFLELNQIQKSDIKLADYLKTLKKLERVNQKMKKEMKKYADFRNSLYDLNSLGLLREEESYFYFLA
jgi:hypothetical protein